MEHVNIEKTEKEFGYKISDLKPSSEKLIYRICECCGKEELKKARSVLKWKQTKCLRCSNKINSNTNINQRGEKIKKLWATRGHPRQGCGHSELSRKKISQSQRENPRVMTEEEKQNLSKRTKGQNNPFFGKKHDAATRQKMSKSAKKRAKRGKDSPLYGKAFFVKFQIYKNLLGEEIKMRSSWETKVARWLDERNINWKYESESFPVTFEFNGEIKQGTYTPDFILDNEIWEVKGYWRKDALCKFKAFQREYPNITIKIIDKKELIKMGIL